MACLPWPPFVKEVSMQQISMFAAPLQLVPVSLACDLIHMSRSSFYRRQKDCPSFPRILKSGHRSVVSLEDLQRWVDELPVLHSLAPIDDEQPADVLDHVEAGFIAAYRTLRYPQSLRVHHELLELLDSQATRSLFEILCLSLSGRVGDYDKFCSEVRRQAQAAELKGLVRKDVNHD